MLYVLKNANNMIVNIIEWDGISPYNPENVTLEALISIYGIIGDKQENGILYKLDKDGNPLTDEQGEIKYNSNNERV